MYNIFIAEDDTIIRNIISEELSNWGFVPFCCQDFQCVEEEIKNNNPHLVLLDINLPFHNGFYWCERIRKFSNVPIIFISSAGDNMNMVTALYAGADDFIPKPFEFSVLIAKIKSLLRRTYEFGESKDKIIFKDIVLDLDNASLILKNKHINLTKNEFLIIRLLMENLGKIVSRTELMEYLWESDEFIDDNTLTVNISRIRGKLSEQGLNNLIVTKKGLGYTIEN